MHRALPWCRFCQLILLDLTCLTGNYDCLNTRTCQSTFPHYTKVKKRLQSEFEMNISVKSEYALKAIFDLANQPQGESVKIAEIAKRQQIPQKFLELILASLKQGGFVES